jgi:hypothetical protein
MALFLLENRDFLGFRMIFKVWLNQIFSNFNTMLWTIIANWKTPIADEVKLQVDFYIGKLGI